MQELQGKVAVVTGAASGIGRALADKAVAEGMKVVLADIEAGPLTETEAALKAKGGEVTAVHTDVTKADQIEKLAQKTIEAYGAVHLLFNNAGVGGPGGAIWENTIADWEWVMGVNLWSVIYGIRTFVPLMLAQDTEAHIVNTASIAGLITYPGSGIYKLTKHGVVTISETLYQELTLKGAKLKVSVLCPAWVNTRIFEGERNRPAELQNDPAEVKTDPLLQQVEDGFRRAVQHGKPPEEIADKVFEAVRQEKFYILPHPRAKGMIQTRMEDILNERNPSSPLPDAG